MASIVDTAPFTKTSPTKTRESTRYPFAVPVEIELSNGLLHRAERITGTLVDLSENGAAIIVDGDSRYGVRKRFRVIIDDYSGIIEVRNLTTRPDGRLRLGVEFKRLGLELQELVSDALATSQLEASRIDWRRDPFRDPTGVADATADVI